MRKEGVWTAALNLSTSASVTASYCMIGALGGALITATPTSAFSAYHCKIYEAYMMEKGILERMRMGKGAEFIINRNTGETSGVFNSSSWRQKIVLDKGSEQQSFKAIHISHPPNMHVRNIYVEEFSPGTEKPFYITTGAEIYTGLCTKH